MATLTQNSVELPASLLAEAKSYAQLEDRAVEALIEEAVRLYMEAEPKQNAFFRTNRAEAKALGYTPEEYAVKVVKEVRAERRASE